MMDRARPIGRPSSVASLRIAPTWLRVLVSRRPRREGRVQGSRKASRSRRRESNNVSRGRIPQGLRDREESVELVGWSPVLGPPRVRMTMLFDNGTEFLTLDKHFKLGGYPIHVLIDSREARANSLHGVWMTVGESLEFLPARDAWIQVHHQYRELRKDLNYCQAEVRTLKSRPIRLKCRKRLWPIVRRILT